MIGIGISIFKTLAQGGASTPPLSLFELFRSRAEAEGFTVEEHDCIINTEE